MRLVLDTNVVVAAMRSPAGASARLLKDARRSHLTILGNVALALEYESVCSLAEHRIASGLSDEAVDTFIDAVIAMLEPIESHFVWRPQLRDPSDELVLEAAVNGRADAIVTFNLRDFGTVPRSFGIGFLLPGDAIKRIPR